MNLQANPFSMTLSDLGADEQRLLQKVIRSLDRSGSLTYESPIYSHIDTLTTIIENLSTASITVYFASNAIPKRTIPIFTSGHCTDDKITFSLNSEIIPYKKQLNSLLYGIM